MNKIFADGKSKMLYLTQNPGELIMRFKDSVHGGGRTQNIAHTGKIRARVCAILFNVLHKNNIKTHLLKIIDGDIFLVRKLKMFKLEIVCRNIAAGSLVKNYPYHLGDKLNPPLVNFHLKLDPDPLLNDSILLDLKLAGKNDLIRLKKLAQRVNTVLTKFLSKKNIYLVDFKFEAGKTDNGEIIIGDEISCDSSRLWINKDKKSLDKDLFRYKTGNVLAGYKSLYKIIST